MFFHFVHKILVKRIFGLETLRKCVELEDPEGHIFHRCGEEVEEMAG